MPANNGKPSLSQRRPALFALIVFISAMALVLGAMAVFRSAKGKPLFASSETIGIVQVDGLIADPDKTVEWLRTLKDDASVKGVLLRINSPGGVVGPSQEIFRAVKDVRAVKPVVASMGAVAASGGYYVAVGANRIVANPGTLTGSIGVRLELTKIKDLASKLGITQEILVSGEFKDATSSFKDLTPEERAYLMALVMDMHGQFVGDVAEGRGMDLAKVQAVADGRGFTGRQALELGLVDELGGKQEAIEVLKKMTGIKGEPQFVEGPQKDKTFFLRFLGGALGAILGEAGGLGSPVEAQGPRWQFLYK